VPDRAPGSRRSLFATVGSISGATSVSRVLGLVREQVVAYYFGASAVTDAFWVAFRIPNLLRDLFAEGAMSSAFVPTFAAVAEREGRPAAWRLGNRVFAALGIALGAVTLAILAFAPGILTVYDWGGDPAKRELTVTMTRILAPFLPFVAFAAVAMGMLNASGRFFVPALAPAWFNVCSIVGIVALVPVLSAAGFEPGLALAIGALAGGAAQFLVQVPALRSVGFRFRPEIAWHDAGLRRIRRLMLPAIFGLAATQLSILVDTALATSLGNGPVSYLQYAFRMIQLPIGLFGVAIGPANLARVSHDAARDDLPGLRRSVAASLRMAAVLTLPSTAGLVALGEPTMRVLFQRGAFDAADTAATGAAVLCYALGLYAYSVTKIQVPTFYALDETRRPVIASAVAVALKIASSFAMLAWLPRFGIAPFLALALSTSLAAWANFGQLAFGLRRRLGSFSGLGVLSTTLRVAAVSAVMGVLVRLAHGATLGVVPAAGTATEIVRLGVLVALGVAITLAGFATLGVPELRDLRERIARRRDPDAGRPS